MARAHAAAEWAALRAQLQTITPAGAARGALVISVLLSVAGMVVATWPTLLPFAVGGLIAWAVLPLVDSLDKVMPRALAASLSVFGVIAVVVAIIVAILPPFALASDRIRSPNPEPDSDQL